MRVRFVTVVLLIVPAMLMAKTPALVGQSIIQHYNCDNDVPGQCGEGVQLTFSPPSFALDFLLRGTVPPSRIEVVVRRTTSQASVALTLRLDGRPYPMATKLLNDGTVHGSVPLADFVRLTSALALTGVVQGQEFRASDKQMRVLRVVANRWTAGISMFTAPSPR